MSTRNRIRKRLIRGLIAYEKSNGALGGIQSVGRREAFIEQLVDSVRRVDFVHQIQARPISPTRRSPHHSLFDPIRAAILCKKSNEIDESCWLTFLAVHCGRHRSQRWRLVQDLYAGDGPGSEWTWSRVSTNSGGFREWLNEKNDHWKRAGTRPRFGNHRKYESIDGSSSAGTGSIVESYVRWVQTAGDHPSLFQNALHQAQGHREVAFDLLYHSMSAVHRFGRLSKFDYLCMLEKLGLAAITPRHPYMDGATGPRKGALKLFGPNTESLDAASARLASTLAVNMQVIEDALCNWVKSPDIYRAFRG